MSFHGVCHTNSNRQTIKIRWLVANNTQSSSVPSDTPENPEVVVVVVVEEEEEEVVEAVEASELVAFEAFEEPTEAALSLNITCHKYPSPQNFAFDTRANTSSY